MSNSFRNIVRKSFYQEIESFPALPVDIGERRNKRIANLALLMFVPSPPFQSRSTDEATAKSWLSAVDMIAERTAAVIIPAKTGPKSLWLTKNKTLSHTKK